MIINKLGFGYKDLTIMPKTFTTIDHRADIDPFTDNKYLPIFAAPMSTIVSLENVHNFFTANILPIIPRSIDYNTRLMCMRNGFWTAFSLKEVNNIDASKVYNICIDTANGHYKEIYNIASKLKTNNPNIKLMVGNIANPETFKEISDMFINYDTPVIDYVRIGIGGGSGCITSTQTGIHYAQASLIDACRKYKYKTKIIADGGIKNYSDVIKALALGADYVMIGGLFASCIESAGDKYRKDIFGNIIKSDDTDAQLYTKFYGMASKQGQVDMFGNKQATAEGTSKFIEVTTNLKQWSDNMEAYLRSAMSYCNSRTLEEFIGKQTLIPTSTEELNSINK
jgi:IMP dehydrogenase/GMP reductase